MLKFKNQALNKAYNIEAETDTVINLPASRTYKAYTGTLSGIPNAEMLEAMVIRGSNLVSKVQDEQEQNSYPVVPANEPEVTTDPPPPLQEDGNGGNKEEKKNPPGRNGGGRNKRNK